MIAKLLGRTGAVAGHDYPLRDDMRIGAGVENDICVVATGVSRVHARIWREGDWMWIEDLGATNGTFLNGDRIRRELLRHLDVITLGRFVDLIFVSSEGEAPVQADEVIEVSIELMDGPDAGTVIDVPKGEITLGRSESCNVVLSSAAISKIHARLQRTADRVILQDLQSPNGTFIDGKRINAPAVVSDGSMISLAGVRTVRVRIRGSSLNVPSDRRASLAAPLAAADASAVDQEWKTRFVWAPDELAQIEAGRAEAVARAAVLFPEKTEGPEKAPAAVEGAPARGTPKPSPAKADAAVPPPGKPPDQQAIPRASNAAKAQERSVAPPPVATPQNVTAAPALEPRNNLVPERPPDVTTKADRTVEDAETVLRARKGRPITGVALAGESGRFSLGRGTHTVGRTANADIRVEDPRVSRSHARMVVTADSVTVEDLQTVNGTVVNGKEIVGIHPLRSGDCVTFGASRFTVEVIEG